MIFIVMINVICVIIIRWSFLQGPESHLCAEQVDEIPVIILESIVFIHCLPDLGNSLHAFCGGVIPLQRQSNASELGRKVTYVAEDKKDTH
jgi:hypothetical protein